MKNILNTTKIRAHHLLCMQGFQGYGYTQDFVTNMAQVIKDINSPHDLEIEITTECDAICSHCPYNKEGVCEKNADSPTELKNMDIKVLKKLGLREGAKVKAKDIPSLIKRRLNDSDIEYICGNCEWKEKCYENL
jgi:hypothetical protein